jgi:hypothetical protein
MQVFYSIDYSLGYVLLMLFQRKMGDQGIVRVWVFEIALRFGRILNQRTVGHLRYWHYAITDRRYDLDSIAPMRTKTFVRVDTFRLEASAPSRNNAGRDPPKKIAWS